MDSTTIFCFLFCSFLFPSLLKSLGSGSRRPPLPPGSLGWPYIGETLQLYFQDPNVFFASKVRKFGSIFKTHILGCPCVMISSPEAARVLITRAHLFKPTFPASKMRMLGKQAIFFHQGEYHAKLRRLVMRAFTPESIGNIVSDIESVAVESLKSWDGQMVSTFQEMKTYTFNVALLSIFGKDEVLYREDLKSCYCILEKGYNSMPINHPGTLFHKSMKAQKELARILANMLSTRRQMNQNHTDLLGSFMGDKEGLTDEQVADNIIGVIFAARDTTASVLTWILKYLAENPSVLQVVMEEQEAIRREKCGEKKILSWADTKKMPITSRVIQETLRVASILSFTFREAVEDVEFEGYLIPKGWKVLPLFRNIHHSPDNFPQPEKFDPFRFEVAPKPNTFLPYGSGTHSCPGIELAKLEILIFIHHLTTKYRYQVFLSFRGMDVRKTFIGHLYKALDHAGFHPFMDEHGIKKGADIRAELEKAIRETRISIIVFSKNFASSTWCLDELVMILKRRSSGHVVLPVFYDVEPSEVRHQIGFFKKAFVRHEEKLKSEKTGERIEELKDKIGTWRAALKEVANLSGMNLLTHANGHEAEFIKQIIRVVGGKLRRPVLDIADRLAEQLSGKQSFIVG